MKSDDLPRAKKMNRRIASIPLSHRERARVRVSGAEQ
jgi:hypothetical protein